MLCNKLVIQPFKEMSILRLKVTFGVILTMSSTLIGPNESPTLIPAQTMMLQPLCRRLTGCAELCCLHTYSRAYPSDLSRVILDSSMNKSLVRSIFWYLFADSNLFSMFFLLKWPSWLEILRKLTSLMLYILFFTTAYELHLLEIWKHLMYMGS